MPVDERIARSVALEQTYVHDVYEQFWENPSGKPWPKVQRFLDGLEPGSIVCDVGCGTGKYFNVNTSVFNIGGDRCERLCQVAHDKDNEVLVLDNLTLPFRDESLDAVVSIAVVHHLATTERRICALRELARVLRIGGRLIISVWAMEQTHRKFESQDVLVPWHRPQRLSTPSLELASTSNTSDDDGFLHYHAYTQTSDSDSSKSLRLKDAPKKRVKSRHKGRSIDPTGHSYPSSSSLSSPNETCYSFVRRAIQKLAGNRRMGSHRPWFLDSWTTCAKDPLPKRCDPEGCEYCECDDVQDLPIELRRIDDEEAPQRRKTFPSSQLINDIYANLKSKSMTNIKTVENNNVVKEDSEKRTKPRLIKQKKSVCEEDADEALDEPTDMKTMVNNLPDFKIFHVHSRGSVFKQRSLNEELMSRDRLKEKENVRQNIQKQTSLNEDLMYRNQQQHAFESLKSSFFSVTATNRFHLLKAGFTNKIKNSTTNIEKVTGSSLKNGFVKMFQNWKSTDLSNEDEDKEDDAAVQGKKPAVQEEKKETGERRHSKEDGSDSSKDSSLQSDTSVDSEDSFASVIFIPKSDPMSPVPLSPGPASPKITPKIKQSSCPTSPRIKQTPLLVYPLMKQLSSPATAEKTSQDESPAQKYAVPTIPKFRRTSLNSTEDNRGDRLTKIREMLTQKATSKSNYPIVRHSSVTNGKVESIAKPLPKLLSLELFNPETDDKDSDSSAVSSPDSVDSVISVDGSKSKKFTFTKKDGVTRSMNLLEAAADVANSLDVAVKKAIKSSPRSKRRQIKQSDVKSVMDSLDGMPLLPTDDCHKHLTDFADKLSEKLMREIEEKSKNAGDNLDDPYISRLSAELQDLSKLSEEIQKQNEYLARLSASDSLLRCIKCKTSKCKCGIPEEKRRRSGAGGAEQTLKGGFSEDLKNSKTEDEFCEGTRCCGDNNQGLGLAKLSVSRNSVRTVASTDSCDSEKGSSTNSMISSASTSINGRSTESTEALSDRGSKESISRYSDGGSTASLVSCPDWKNMSVTAKPRMAEKKNEKSSQESLQSDNVGGEITYHRYYHVFREGELDQLIEKYVQNLHIISSYYDHASWCVVAEKVQVWTI